MSLSSWTLNWDCCPQGLLRSYWCHLKWKIRFFAVFIRPNRSIRHGRPQHPDALSRDNIQLPLRATPVDALIPQWPNSAYSSWRQIDCPMGSGIWGTIRLCLGVTAIYSLHSDICKVIQQYGRSYHSYADDNQLYSSCNQHECADLKSRMIKCIESIGEWMSTNWLMLNPSKSEFMWCASQCQSAYYWQISFRSSQWLSECVVITSQPRCIFWWEYVHNSVWNHLPDNVKVAGTIELFKHRLKTHLFRQSFEIPAFT